MSEPYFGYTTAGNARLLETRQLANRMGEDIRYYPPPQGSGSTIDSTIDWQGNDPYTGWDADDPEFVAAFANDSPERIYHRVMAQDSAAVRAVARQWQNVSYTLDEIAQRVRETATQLREGTGGSDRGWTGAGADAFLAQGPGATLKSLDDWKDAALKNAGGAFVLADKIDTYQAQMESFWEEYKAYMVERSDQWLEQNGFDSVDQVKSDERGSAYSSVQYNDVSRYADSMKMDSFMMAPEARQIQAEMAEAYRRVTYEEFAGGRETVYEGPTNAVAPNQAFIDRAMAGNVPSIGAPPQVTPPSVTAPTITPPNIQTPTLAAVTTPTGVTPAITSPNVTPPAVTAPSLPAGQAAPNVTVPHVTAPNVPVPHLAAPAGLAGGGGAPGSRPGTLPGAPGTGRLLSNLPPGGVSGVLRGAGAGAEGLPPSLPQGGRPGQTSPPPRIKGRGPTPDAPAMPPPAKGGPDRSKPATPATPGGSAPAGQPNQFGGPPGAPASPVLRNPRSTPAEGPGPRRGTPARSGPAVPGGPPVPPRPGTSSPVLGRPRRSDGTPGTPVVRPPTAPGKPGAPVNPLAPPPPPTSSPVVGRLPRPASGASQPEPAGGVVRGSRHTGPSGYVAEIASRRREKEPEPEVSRVDSEFDKITRLLDREAPWTVPTPGGGVLDAGPTRNAPPAAEPKPTLGS